MRAAVTTAETLVDCLSFQHVTTHGSRRAKVLSTANERFKVMLGSAEAGFRAIADIYGFATATVERTPWSPRGPGRRVTTSSIPTP